MRVSLAVVVFIQGLFHSTSGYEFHSSNEDCYDDTEEAILDLSLDENTSETGWTLICDDEVIWDATVGSFTNSPPGTWLKESTCVSKTSTCTFTVIDLGGDGFTSDGFFAMKYGATTIAISSYGVSDPFSERSYCFGPDCDEPPLEQAELEDETEEDVFDVETKDETTGCQDGQEEAVFDLYLDQTTEETGWLLACDGETIWDIPPGTLTEVPGEWINRVVCIDKTSTCSFAFFDSTGDGLSAADFYTFVYGATTVAVSEYGSAEAFSEKIYCFGPECAEPPLEIAEGLTEDYIDLDNDVDNNVSSNDDKDENKEPPSIDHDDDKKNNDGVDGIVVDESKSKESTKNRKAIIGGTIGGVLLSLVLLIAIVVFVMKGKRNNVRVISNKEEKEEEEGTIPPSMSD